MAEKKMTDNLTMRIWLELIENIVGSNGLRSTLNYAHLEKYIDNFPPDDDQQEIPVEDIVGLHSSLIELFGQKGARVLQLRAGKEFIRIGAAKRPEIAERFEKDISSLPESEKIRISLGILAEQHEKRWSSGGGPRFEFKEDDDYIMLIDKDNPMVQANSSESPQCGVFVGMIQYQIEMITQHKHQVKEVQCKAMGDPADVFRIAKVPEED